MSRSSNNEVIVNECKMLIEEMWISESVDELHQVSITNEQKIR